MRVAVFALVMMGYALPAGAARHVSVVELQQLLTAQAAAHKSDAAIAQELNDLELTEELTPPTLQSISAATSPGPQTAQALELLADASALLVPPPSELPVVAKPDMAAQRAMFSGAVDYVVKTLQHLPNFLATRETRSFDDSPNVVGHSGYAPVTPLHFVGTFHREITYRNGKEVLEAPEGAAKSKTNTGPAGLMTWGEFGPVLAIILTDSLKGRVTWSRWEDGANGRVGVFHYEVPQAASHYHVDYCCVWEDSNLGASYHGTPGYHGDLFLDPTSGAIVRVTLEAELKPTDLVRRAAISVLYGPVEIGGTRYICPIHSVAISQDMNRPGKTIGGSIPVTRINETAFTGYHRFGSTSRILASVPDNLPAPTANAPAQTTSATMSQRAAAPAETSTMPSADTTTAAPAASSAPPVETTTAATTEPVISRAAVEPAPQATTDAHATAETTSVASNQSTPETPVFRTSARDVVLDVVVTKGNGDAVTALGQQDFAITEDGKPQTIDFFEEHTAAELSKNVEQEMPPLPAAAVTNVPPATVGDAVNVLLLDSLNTSPQVQANVHREILDFLKEMKPGTRMAIFTLGSKLRYVQGFTTDSSALLAALKQGEQGEKHGRTRSDATDDASDIAALQAMQSSGYAIAALQAEQANARAEDLAARASMTFQALTYLAHYLSGVPGRKNLLWFASSFPVVIFPSQEETKSIEKNPVLRGTMTRAKETADLFTSAQISIYPIGAEGMMTEHMMDADSAGPGAPAGIGHAGSAPESPVSNGTMSPLIAGASERAQVIGAMEQLAVSTGGKAFYNTNDLNRAMEKAIDDGANYYTIGYSPTDKTMDGSFRRIDVNVTHGKYKLSYRHGYNAEETPPPSPQVHVNPLTDLLEYGLPGATGVLYGVTTKAGPTEEASPLNRAGSNTALQGMVIRYMVDFTIRAGDLELKPSAQGDRSAHLLIGLKAYDKDGNAVNWEGDDETLDLKQSEYAALIKNGVSSHLMIDLPANRPVRLVTAVYDWNSGKAGSVEFPLGTANAK